MVIEQLTTHRQPENESLVDEIATIKAQIQEVERREQNALIIAAESHEVDVRALDAVLSQFRRSKVTLRAFKRKLVDRQSRGETFENELYDVALRLASLQDRIHKATFEDKRRAITELVRSIRVSTETMEGQSTAVIEITYRFDEPIAPVISTEIIDTLVVSGTPRRKLPILDPK